MTAERASRSGWLASWLDHGGLFGLLVVSAGLTYGAAPVVASSTGIRVPPVVGTALLLALAGGTTGLWLHAQRTIPTRGRLRRSGRAAVIAALAGALPALLLLLIRPGPDRAPPVWFGVVGLIFMLQGPLWVVTILLWPPRPRQKEAWWYIALDVAVMLLALAVLFWFGQVRLGGGPASVSGLYGPTVAWGFILLGLSTAVLRGSVPEYEVAFRLVVAAVAITFVTNFGLVALGIGNQVSAVLVPVLQAGVWILFALGAEAVRLKWSLSAKRPEGASTSPLPWVAVLAVGLLAIRLALTERESGVGPVVLGTLCLALLLLIRQSVMMRQNARLLAERAVHQADARIAALVRHTSDVILIADRDFQIRFASPSAEGLWAGDPKRLLGLNVGELVDPLQRVDVERALIERLSRPGQSATTRWRMLGAEGDWRRIEAVVTNLLHEPSVGGIVLTLRDQTDRADLEEQLHQAQKMEAIGQLAGGIAHDFNNLLTTVLGHSELGLDSLPPGHPVRSDFEQIRRAGELAAALTKQLLAFSRKQLVEPRAIDLAETIDRIAGLLRRLIEESVTTVVNVAPDAGMVEIDPNQLEQIVINLAVNARDAMPHGGTLTIAVRRELVASELPGVVPVAPGDYLVVDVGDTGVGMDAATRARIFEPFFTTKPPGRGTGLGLASVYGAITQNRCGMRLRTSPGQGSTFSIYLRRTEARDPAASPVVPPRGGNAHALILVVEDEPWLRDIACKVLTREGYRVLVAADAPEALVHFTEARDPPDLLLTDVVMPGMSGPRLAARLRQSRPGLRVLFMSGYVAADLGGDLGPDDQLLRKPFTPYVLLEAVRAVLDPAGHVARGIDNPPIV